MPTRQSSAHRCGGRPAWSRSERTAGWLHDDQTPDPGRYYWNTLQRPGPATRYSASTSCSDDSIVDSTADQLKSASTVRFAESDAASGRQRPRAMAAAVPCRRDPGRWGCNTDGRRVGVGERRRGRRGLRTEAEIDDVADRAWNGGVGSGQRRETVIGPRWRCHHAEHTEDQNDTHQSPLRHTAGRQRGNLGLARPR